MSNRPTGSSQQDNSLQRGKACLSCRRRKMRCDGERPYCTQCLRGNRADDCEYTDSQGRTRTQMLEENVAILQARIHELENPRIAAQAVRLHDPYEARRAPNPRRPGSSALIMHTPASGVDSLAWWELEEPPARITDMLVGTFTSQADALGFALSPERFREEVSLPLSHPERPHSALLYAVILWSLHLSNCEDFTQHENLYLQRSILALQDALGRDSDSEKWIIARHRVHAIQAEVLLAQYFFSLGRLLEGRYHASAALSLAISCGMHQMRAFSPTTSPRHHPDVTSSIGISGSVSSLELSPPRDALEFGERVRLFWSVYTLDRCWSASLGAPCVLTDNAELGTQIDTAWPLDIHEYETMQSMMTSSLPVGGDITRTVQRFISGEPLQIPPGVVLSASALYSMASALFERSARRSQCWFRSNATEVALRDSIRSELQTLARTTMHFARGLTPVDQLLPLPQSPSHGTSQESHETLLVTHSLAHATMLTLHTVRASEVSTGDLSATNSALVHASEIVKILEKLCETDRDTSIRDPILSIVGFLAAQVFIRELHRMRRLSETQELTGTIKKRLASLQESISRVINALRRCADNSPIFSQQAEKILEMMDD